MVGEEEIERKKKRGERGGGGRQLPPWKSSRKRTPDLSSRTFSRKRIKGEREGVKKREKNKRGNGLAKNLLVFSRGGFLNRKMKGKDFEREESTTTRSSFKMLIDSKIDRNSLEYIRFIIQMTFLS